MEELELTDINGNKKAWRILKKKEFKEGIRGLSKYNSETVVAFLKDLEDGINCSTKGSRSPASLLRNRRTARVLARDCKNKEFDKLTKEEMSKIIAKEGNEDFARNVKIIFKWLHRTGRIKENPTEHIAPKLFSKGKPAWVYLGEEGMKRLINSLGADYRALTSFLFDSVLRPEEAWKIRVFDFQEDFAILDIPEKRSNGERVAKKNTFGRKIKLKMCSALIKEYVKREDLKPTDLIFTVTQSGFNKALRKTAVKLFGNNPTKARESPNKITAYDIRHNSACFWLKRYKTNRDLMYRCGWKSEDKIFYYTEFLDMRDTIDDEDLITPEDKTKMETKMNEQDKQIKELKKQIDFLMDAIETKQQDDYHLTRNDRTISQ